jgi:hypothetical protein
MLKKISLTIAAGLVALLVPVTAQAGSLERGATVEVSTDPTDIVWVEASLEDTDAEHVQVQIFSPKHGGPRELWQRCKFRFSGAGTYRCGIDVAEGTSAHNQTGTWVTSVTVDGAPVASTKFSVSP